MDRAALRRRIAERTTPDSRARDSRAITEAIVSSAAWREAGCVFCYIRVGREVSTEGIIRRAIDQGKRLCVPRVLEEPGLMEAALYNGEPMERGRFGIPSPADAPVVTPESIDLIILPGLAFSLDGARIGQGGGYYDRYLARSRAYRIAPAFACQVYGGLTVNPWDQRVHALALPDGIIVTGVKYEPNR